MRVTSQEDTPAEYLPPKRPRGVSRLHDGFVGGSCTAAKLLAPAEGVITPEVAMADNVLPAALPAARTKLPATHSDPEGSVAANGRLGCHRFARVGSLLWDMTDTTVAAMQ